MRTLLETSKLLQAINEMEQYNLDILCLSETRRTSSGKLASKGHKVLGAKPDFRRADIRPPEESSGWLFRNVRMEPVLVSLFIGRKGTHTAD